MIALQSAAQGAVEQMALSLVAGSALAASAWTALRMAPRQSSRARFALWFGVLVSIALLPALALLHFHARVDAGTSAWLTIPESWTIYIFGFWAIAASAGLARVAAGLWQVRRVRASCEEIAADALPELVRQTLSTFLSRRAVRLCVSDAVRVPTAIGFFRPTVVIPRWLLAELPASELNQIVLHELAHLARWDDWTNLAQKTLRAALFFHPAVWWIDERLSLEREMACDDVVIAATEDRHSYAQCLALLAEKTFGRRGAALAQAAVHRIQQLTTRVIRILEPQTATARGAWTWWVTVTSGLALAAMVVLGAGTPVIGFRSAPVQAARAEVVPPTAGERFAPRNFAVPAAMHIAGPRMPQHAVQRKRAKVSPQPRMVAAARVANRVSPNVTGGVIPARAILHPGLQPSDVMVLTVFTSSSDSQSWNVQVWHLTVYVPAASAPAATPRKTT